MFLQYTGSILYDRVREKKDMKNQDMEGVVSNLVEISVENQDKKKIG